MKAKKITAFALAALMLAASVPTAFAEVIRVERDLSVSQSYNPNGWYQGYYDVGSTFPWDDVRCQTFTNAGVGNLGRAYACVKALNGVKASDDTRVVDKNGWCYTNWPTISSQDYAKLVRFYSCRVVNNIKTSKDVYLQ